jgi:hypothetical protein
MAATLARYAGGVTPEHAQAIRTLVAAAQADAKTFPAQAYAEEEALLVHSTNALFAYYLGADGTVYELDLDKALGGLEPVGDAAQIREVYAAAAAAHPELRGLR